jgi:hypothetical protein
MCVVGSGIYLKYFFSLQQTYITCLIRHLSQRYTTQYTVWSADFCGPIVTVTQEDSAVGSRADSIKFTECGFFLAEYVIPTNNVLFKFIVLVLEKGRHQTYNMDGHSTHGKNFLLKAE